MKTFKVYNLFTEQPETFSSKTGEKLTPAELKEQAKKEQKIKLTKLQTKLF